MCIRDSHEHPAHATSWAIDEMKALMQEYGVDVYQADQCMYGLVARAQGGWKCKPAKKPTRFMTNSRALAKELQKKCDRTHEHQVLLDGRAAGAARYPAGLCKAICRGIVREKKERTLHIIAVMEVTADQYVRPRDLDEFHDRDDDAVVEWHLRKLTEGQSTKKGVSEALAWDDLTGMRLEAGKVREARMKDIWYIRDNKVCVTIPRAKAHRNGW